MFNDRDLNFALKLEPFKETPLTERNAWYWTPLNLEWAHEIVVSRIIEKARRGKIAALPALFPDDWVYCEFLGWIEVPNFDAPPF
jgi:hypothetical protein